TLLHLLKYLAVAGVWSRCSVFPGEDRFDLEDLDLVADLAAAGDEGDRELRLDFEQLTGRRAGEALAFAEDAGDLVGDQQQRVFRLRADAQVVDDRRFLAGQGRRREDPVPDRRLAVDDGPVGLGFAAGDLDVGGEAEQPQAPGGCAAATAALFVGDVGRHLRRRVAVRARRLGHRRGRGRAGRGELAAEFRARGLRRRIALLEGVRRAAVVEALVVVAQPGLGLDGNQA